MSATAIALLPVKTLARSKQRLADTLDAGRRRALAEYLFAQSFDRLVALVGPARTAVVSADDTVLGAALRAGAHAIREAGDSGLNAALATAHRDARLPPADMVLVLPIDLPLLSTAEISALLAAARPGTMTIAPDRHGTGTNGLVVPRRLLGRLRFGRDSLRAHAMLAAEEGLAVERLRLPGFALDLDDAADLALAASALPAGLAKAAAR